MPQQLTGVAASAAAPKRPAESATEMVQVVLPNDANPLGFILGGTVMHLIDIAGAIACHRHTRVTCDSGTMRCPAWTRSGRRTWSGSRVS